jgi:hypothetical protein
VIGRVYAPAIPRPDTPLVRPAHVVGNTELAERTGSQFRKPLRHKRSLRFAAGKWRYPATTPTSIIAPPGDSQHIDTVPAKRTHAGGRPESECRTVASFKRHQRRGETPDAGPCAIRAQHREDARERKEMAG